jgi:hypothetical protein
MYSIWYQGYETPCGRFRTLTEVRKELAASKKEDKQECRRKFGRAEVEGSKDSYRISAGCNVWSAAGIIEC